MIVGLHDISSWLRGSISRLADHSRQPLHRNAYALMASSGLTSVLGLAYWTLAARMYRADSVGLNAAAISAMMFLAGLAQLNLTSVLVRFVPVAERNAGRLILGGYAISVVVAFCAGLAFIEGVPFWTPALSDFRSSPQFVAWFVASTVAWSIFVLEDSAMTGLRRATWVPVSNGIFAIAKIVLLIVLAGFAPAYGIFGSWTIALAITVLFTNAVIFARLVPSRVSRNSRPTSDQSVRSIARYASADYIASLFWLTCTTLLPVIVTGVLGVRANAYFYLAWQIGYSLHILSINTGSSLIVEAVISRDELAEYSRRVFQQNLRITIPIAITVVLIAPYLMQVFGPNYAVQGTRLLQLLALAAVPFSVVSLAISVARVQRRMRRVVSVLAVMCITVLALTQVLLREIGLAGVGVAWLATQVMLAVILLATQLSPLWFARMPNKVRQPSILFDHARRFRAHWRRAQFAFTFNRVSGKFLTRIGMIDGHVPADSWQVERIVSVTADIAVLMLKARGHESTKAVLKVARTSLGEASIRANIEVMRDLRGDPRLSRLHPLIPRLLSNGELPGRPFAVEEKLSGEDGRLALANPARRARALRGAVDAISVLHERTASSVVIDDMRLQKWVDEPIQHVRRLANSHLGVARELATLERLRIDLRNALLGIKTNVATVHGDFVPGNVLVDPESDAITGIIDWDQARAVDLPILDVVHFLLAARIAASGGELGGLVGALLGRATLTPEERDLVDRAALSAGMPGCDQRLLIVMCWLRHLANNLGKSTWYERHRWWVRSNVEDVLSSFAESTGEAKRKVSSGRIGANARLRADRPTRTADDLSASRVQPIPILLYHSISRNPSPSIAPFTVSPDVFARHMDLVADASVVMTIRELVARLDRQEPIPQRAVIITFDDGFADNLYCAAPLLSDRGLKATIFITTGYVDGTTANVPGQMLSWQGVRELDAAGFEIGAHGHGHRPLDVLPINRVREDIGRSKILLEQTLGHGLVSFAYPHGYRTYEVRDAVRAAGFECACGVRNAFSHPLDDRWSLARLTVRADTREETLAAWLGGGAASVATPGDSAKTVVWRGVRRLRIASGAAE